MSERAQIVLIDDERDILSGLCVRMKAFGFDVRAAGDAMTGLTLATETVPDAIVMDVRMPGMDGLELLDRLKQDERTRDIPVIVLSANVVEKTRAKAIALGARRFIQKPFQADRLLTAVQQEIRGRAPLQSLPPN